MKDHLMSFPLPADRMSEAEFLAMPESLDRVELIDGEVIVAPSPSVEHQQLVVRLAAQLQLWAEANPPAFVGVAPLDLRLRPGRIVQPDLFVFHQGLRSPAPPIDQVPELVIEVLSRMQSYDRITKRVLYREAGVSEYWLVDPEARRVEVLLADREETASDELRSRAIPGLVIDLHRVFR